MSTQKRPARNRAGQTLDEFLASYHPGDYPRPCVTADLVLLSPEREPKVLMVKRANHPWIGCWALPGGFVEQGESTEEAARREIREECSLAVQGLSSLGVFSDPDRDPRGWVISCAYAGVAQPGIGSVLAGDDAAEAAWFQVDFRFTEGRIHLTLTGAGEVLTAAVEADIREGPFGSEIRTGAFTADGIAADHACMIAAALLRLNRASRREQP